MKKILIALIVIVILVVLVLCFLVPSTKPTAHDCQMAWNHLSVGRDNEGLIIMMILNTEQAPDTVGELLQECLRDGWRPAY